MQDAALLELIRNDPNEGMRQLISLYSGLVYSIVGGKLRSAGVSQADIDACAADTFSEFYIHIERYDPKRCGVKTWLCVIAKNVSISAYRKAVRDGARISMDDDVSDDIPDDFSLEGEVVSKLEREALTKAVNDLGEPDREIIVRKYYLGQSSKEIAGSLGLTVSNVDTRTHRAIKKLRTRFGGKDNEKEIL